MMHIVKKKQRENNYEVKTMVKVISPDDIC